MLEIGSTVGGIYKILNVIGKGGMSVVYLAMNEKANKQWAVKEVRKDGISNFEVVKQGLVAETNMLKKLSHPNLPDIIDVIENEDTFIIVMDYIEGNSLSKALKEYGALPQSQVIMWAKQLCDVLGYLHSQDPPIIYRDMKPSNVMLSPDGKKVTLIDFGTAREYKSQNIADTTCLGTIGYAAPEQFGGHGQTDARTDIYCLGATLYHLVTGQNPSEPPYEIKPIREWNPALSEGLEKIIIKCTQKNPDDRYQSCNELMYDLEHYDELDTLTRKRQSKKLRIFVALLAASAVFFCGGFVFQGLKRGQTDEIYKEYLTYAENAPDTQTKIENYMSAIELKPEQMQPYKLLIDAMMEDDLLSKEESSIIRGYNTRIKALSEEKDYPQLIYDISKMYWSCYVPIQGENIYQNILNAKEWLDILSKYDKFDNIKTATVMKYIADYTDSSRKNINQIDSSKSPEDSLELYNNLKSLLEYVEIDTSDVLRIKTYDLLSYIIGQEATDFKKAGIEKGEVDSLFNSIQAGIESIDNSNLGANIEKALTQLGSARQSAENSYKVGKGG
ncbi:MAG: serine/threonine protein kinase [Clostridiales bacterium]|nr:serine/threonine protein kinase [Clostridiales bacterium]